MVPEPLTQGKAVGVSGENKASKNQCRQTPSLPRHFGRTSAVAVNLFIVPIGGRGLLWSPGWMQTEDFNYALIKWESLHRNGVRSLPPYPSILNQQLSGSLWIKDIAIYQQQHTASLQVRPMGNRPTPPSVPSLPPSKKTQKIQGLLRIMDFSGTMKVSVPTSCHSCLRSKWHLICGDNTMEARGPWIARWLR